MIKFFGLLTLALTLVGCGDAPQTLSGTRRDTAAFEGASNPYSAPGWKAGDKKAWEQQLKTRAQNGQNEYNRVN